MDAEYEIRRRNVIKETGELYIEAVAARENVRFLEASLKRSKDTANLVSQLSEAGRVTISSVQQAKLEVQKTELKLAQAGKASERASQALTAQWGDSRSSLVTDQRIDAPLGEGPHRTRGRTKRAGHRISPRLVRPRLGPSNGQKNRERPSSRATSTAISSNPAIKLKPARPLRSSKAVKSPR